MEKKHAARLRERYADTLVGKTVIVLHIPDDYTYLDPALIDLLRAELAAYVDL